MAIKDIIYGMCGTSRCKLPTYSKEKIDELLGEKAKSSDVYTKTETDTLLNTKANSSDIYVKGNYAVLTGTVTGSGQSVTVSYPTGFTLDNCAIISAVTNYSYNLNNQEITDGGWSLNNQGGSYYVPSFSMRTGGVYVMYNNVSGSSLTVTKMGYKIVLMKYE